MKNRDMDEDRRYHEQQRAINEIAARLGLVAYRPDYHGRTRDKNTVLLYTKEDHEHNCEVDTRPIHYGSADEAKMFGCTDETYFYRPYLWCFENTDVNGMFSFDFAEHGAIDLRYSADWRDAIAGAIETRYYRLKQNIYVRSNGGYLNLREADDEYNGYNRKIIEAFCKAYGGHDHEIITGKVNPSDEGDPIYRKYKLGDPIYNFSCDFVIRKENEKLEELIRNWRSGVTPLGTARTKEIVTITDTIERVGGYSFIWY